MSIRSQYRLLRAYDLYLRTSLRQPDQTTERYNAWVALERIALILGESRKVIRRREKQIRY